MKNGYLSAKLGEIVHLARSEKNAQVQALPVKNELQSSGSQDTIQNVLTGARKLAADLRNAKDPIDYQRTIAPWTSR